MIGNILSSPELYTGKQVEIVGYYRGWDLLKEIQSGPPVSRSDWVIADDSGAIYVTGLAPQRLDPSSRNDIDAVIHLTAIVERNQKGTYLNAQKIELLSP